jgi:NAD(P)H-hydrate epimerase
MTAVTPDELFTAELSAAADRHTMDTLGVPSPVLMERASLCVAHELCAALAGEDLPIWVLVGPGNNGGDGLAVSRILTGWGHRVFAVLTTPKRNDACEQQLQLARASGVEVLDALPDPPARAVVVDGMLGTGSTGAPRGGIADALRWQSSIVGLRVAIDIPSGVEVDTGQRHDGAFRANLTVTFVRSKPGLHVTPGRDAAGTVVVADIGITPDPAQSSDLKLIGPDAVAELLRALPAGAHKNQRGHVGVVGGGEGTPGAAILAATAAMRTGAGLVTIVSSSVKLRRELIEWRPELMVASLTAGATPLPRAGALVVGPGLTDPDPGLDLAALYRDDERPALWDASALDHVPFEAPVGPRLLTPHPGEAARMLARAEPGHGWTAGQVQGDRLAAAARLAQLTHAVVVLKGEGSIVASPQGLRFVAVSGSSALATAGSGDVLAGIGGALLGRGLAALQAGIAAVHVHGVAGDLAATRRPIPMAADIAEAAGWAVTRCESADHFGSRWPRVRRG